MEPNEFSEKKAEKHGELTPKALVKQILEAIELGEIDAITVVARYKDGNIDTGWSTAVTSEIIGLLELGKIQVADFIRE